MCASDIGGRDRGGIKDNVNTPKDLRTEAIITGRNNCKILKTMKKYALLYAEVKGCFSSGTG